MGGLNVSEKKTSVDSIALYDSEYFLRQVDGFNEFADFKGRFDELFERYRRNVKLLGLDYFHKYLEFGCGRGEICIYHAVNGGDSTGVDYSRDAIALAKAKAEKLSVNVGFYAESFSNFMPAIGGYDRILAAEFIEHISRDEGELFMNIAYGALRRGGRLLIYTHPNTLQRKYGYPILRFIFSLRGRGLPKQQPDTLSEHYKHYHLNEQNYYSLRSMARRLGASKFEIGYDSYDYVPNQKIKNFIRYIIKRTPLRHLFLTDLYMIIEK